MKQSEYEWWERGVSLKNTLFFLSGLGQSEEVCTISRVKKAVVIFREGQRKLWVMHVQLEKIILNSGLIMIQHWFLLLLCIIHFFFDYSKNSQVHNMDFNVCVLDIQVRSHFPNHLFHLLVCMDYAVPYLCYKVENAIFTEESGTDVSPWRYFYIMAYHPNGSESFEGYWTVNVPYVSHYKTQTWVKEFDVNLLWKCSVQLSKKNVKVYTCSKIF